MGDNLDDTGRGNSFVIFGELDILPTDNNQIQVKINGVDVFYLHTGEDHINGADGVDSVGVQIVRNPIVPSPVTIFHTLATISIRRPIGETTQIASGKFDRFHRTPADLQPWSLSDLDFATANSTSAPNDDGWTGHGQIGHS